jgi:hypothetical protein
VGVAAHGQNVVPNPGFTGAGGQVLPIAGGMVNAPSGCPDNWRSFAVGATSAIDLEVVPVAADELFAGSPETNSVLLRLNGVGADQGFDSDNGRFPILPGLDYHGEFYFRSANADLSDQTFHFGFPLFNQNGEYLGMEPGGSANNLATSEWTLFTGPIFQPQDPVAQGHISWRCVDDGGENAIQLALPSVTFTGEQVLPTGLACTKDDRDVTLAWINHTVYDDLRVLRDGVEIASLAVDAQTYTDVMAPVGDHTYQVEATVGLTIGGPSCMVSVFDAPAPGALVSVDLGEIDVVNGLVNSFRDGATDGENMFVVCGPEGDLREARSNLGGDDPTPDAPDSLFYFTVTDPPIKGQEVFRLEVEVYDDPLLAGVVLFLQYTNRDSTGPADIPNTFFPLAAPPVRTLAGTGAWTILAWDLEDAGFRSFQQGVADFRVGVVGSARICVDTVRLSFFPRPVDLTCRANAGDVELNWTNLATYTGITVFRDDVEIATLPGSATSYTDPAVPEGDHRYQVTVELAGLEGGPECAVTVFVVPPGTAVSADLGDLDLEDGLSNVGRGSPGDGENEFLICGPEGDLREGRSNLAATDPDPAPDVPDGIFYFSVTDPEMKAQSAFTLRVTVHDDPARAGALIALQYTNSVSTGPGDIPNTFFPLTNPPTNALAGTGAWVDLEWEITDAGFRNFQQGVADFRLIVTDGGRVCIDRAELVFGETGSEPVFLRGDGDGLAPINITDPIYVLNFLFSGGDPPPCPDAADGDDVSGLNITDPIRVLNFLFAGGPPPPAPGPETCGPDPTPDELGPCTYNC